MEKKCLYFCEGLQLGGGLSRRANRGCLREVLLSTANPLYGGPKADVRHIQSAKTVCLRGSENPHWRIDGG